MATDGPTPEPCKQEIYSHGKVIGIYATNGSCAFEKLIKRVSEKCGVEVDWHYAAGRAIVKTMPENVNTVLPVLEQIVGKSYMDLGEFK